ncbi:MAG: ACT domain-containing protein [Halieaceae bacterium]|jgi:glycine cleavage system regulatory protein|nr:ACT domain-containing protein [Halieaceae bacterium]MBT5134630.1 ACT domain-containing protein [Halieaceae bacterium]MBT5555310.1 ACT domain-containing protein [Halieaceae bacterium]MBT6180461.1 ACT domain-containing protein [Halieaceae bacterium]MDG1799476.1 ACT domain-containing protein [Luminiphilus sp.]
MQQQYVITFAGADRTGLVETLADLVKAHDGDWQQSELTRLGGAFAGVILVSVSSEGFEALDQAVQTGGNTNLSIHLTRATAEPAIEPNLRLTLTGPDRPGIVYEITHELAELQINILHFSSHVQSGAWSGEALFFADLETRTPANLDLDELRDRLDAVEEKMTLEIDIESDSA